MKRSIIAAVCGVAFIGVWVSVGFSEVAPIVVESKCTSGGTYVEGGTGWGNSSSKSKKTTCTGGSRSTKNAAAWADFIPPVVTEGTYHIFLTWGVATASNSGPNAEHVKVTISDGDGSRDVYVDMRGSATCATNADELIYVGQGRFTPGAGHKVRVSNTATGQCYNGASKRFVTADAVVLEFMVPVPVLPTSWGSIKARYGD
jgi:hypothetical protein